MKAFLFITKIGIALFPFILIDVLLITLGFSYSAKNVTLLKYLTEQPIHKNTINIAFLGTSRTNLGISPNHIQAGIGLSEKPIQIVNLGMDGVSSAAVLPLVKNVRVPFDYFFIEILPVEDLLNDTNVFMSPVKPYQEWDNWLTFLISKEFILTKSWELSMFWAGRSPIYFMKCHHNGWTEVKAGKNPLAIEKAKEKWIRFAHTTFRNQQIGRASCRERV